MKKILILLYIFLSIGTTNAENNLLKSISQIKTFSADFIQVNIIKDFGEDVYEGKVKIINNKKAIWDYEKPFSVWYLLTKDTIKHYDSSIEQLMTYKNNSDSTNILLEVLMDFSKINEQFNVVKVNNNTLNLNPKIEIDITTLEITVKNGLIKKIKSIDHAENESEIIFSNIKVNKTINDKEFDKVVPKNTTIITE